MADIKKSSVNGKDSKVPIRPMGPGGGHGKNSGRFSEVVKAKNSKKTITRLMSYLQKEKFLLILVVMIVTFSTLVGLLGPYLMGVAIDDYIAFNDIPGLIRILTLLAGVYIISALSRWLQVFVMVKASQSAIKQVRYDLFKRIQDLSLDYFDKKSTGDLMSRLINDIDNINNTLTESITQFISSVLTIVGTLVMMFTLSWQMALVALIPIPLITIGIKNITKVTRKYFRNQQSSLGKVNGLIEEKISAQKVIKAYGKEDQVIEEFIAANDELREVSIKAQIFSRFIGPMMNLFKNMSLAILIFAGSLFAMQGLITVGMIATFVNYMRQFNRPLASIASLYNTIQSAVAGAERVFEVIDEKPTVQDIDTPIQLDDILGHVEFEKVHFEYNKDEPVLRDVSFETKPGEIIALVGPTGAGKTTIINLLTRFYDLKEGMIKVDGKDISLLKKDELRRNLGIVLQDTFLFSGSVKDNIRYGKLDATDEEIVQAAKYAYAHHFIECLPKGYETNLTKEGNNLSHGQRQLIAIARAILADTPILILDEATSSVDTRTEVSIQKAFKNLMKGKTSFVIAHRLSTIREADQILVIDDGRIVERGNHSELMASEGFYHNLYVSQFKKRIS